MKIQYTNKKLGQKYVCHSNKRERYEAKIKTVK